MCSMDAGDEFLRLSLTIFVTWAFAGRYASQQKPVALKPGTDFECPKQGGSHC